MRTLVIAVLIWVTCLGGNLAQLKAQTSGRPYRSRSMEDRRRETLRRRDEVRNEMDRIVQSVIQQVLDANDSAWKVIQPQLKTIEKLQSETNAHKRIAASASGGSSGGGSSSSRGSTGSGGSSSGSTSSRGSSRSRSGGGSSGSAGGSASDLNRPERSITKGNITYVWSWGRFPNNKEMSLTEGQRACESLLAELERPNPDRSEVTAKVKRLQEFRQKAKLELAEAQQRLRVILTEEQQDIMVLMGYLI